MPSLRRTSSSPNVRSSPYSSLTRPSHPFRRSPDPPGSVHRRVLADIDWWTVADGQSNKTTPLYNTATVNDNNENHLFIPSHVSQREDQQLDSPPNPADSLTTPTSHFDLSINTITLSAPHAQFAALSIAPRAIPLNFRRHTFPGPASTVSSVYSDDPLLSSVESSPDLPPVPLTPPPLQNPAFIMSFADEYTPSFLQNNHTPPRLSLGSPFKSSSWSGPDDDDFICPLFGYRQGFGSLRPLVEDDIH